MISAIRQQYNQDFTKEKYQAYINELHNLFPGQLDFRVAETPIYVPKGFTQKILDTCDYIVEQTVSPAYKKYSERAIPAHLRVPNEDDQPHFIAFDFGVCSENGELVPKLIEMQGFPSLFAWNTFLPEVHKKYFHTPGGFSDYLNGFDKESYVRLLKKIIIADADPENVVLLEINPHLQKTRVDFYATESLIGIPVVNLADVIKEGKELFYKRNGRKIRIERIYNRVIFDDLFQQSEEIQEKGKIFQEDLNVAWVPHPNWFYRLSKFTLPFIQHPYVPETKFLSDVQEMPGDLNNYVVKPLFSFAGQGVIIDVTKEEIENITDPENWILQRKVVYADAVQTPEEPAKAEIRIFYFWEPGSAKPIATNNLSRLSKGKMVGVRYNKDKDWVGGSFCLFEK